MYNKYEISLPRDKYAKTLKPLYPLGISRNSFMILFRNDSVLHAVCVQYGVYCEVLVI
jgi:hypothetical protein